MISRFTTCFNGSREYQVFIQNWLLCLWKDRWSSFSSSYLSSLLCLFHFWYIEQFVFYWSMFWIFPCSKNPIRRSKSIFEESWKRRCHWFFKCNCSWWRIIDGNKIRKAVFLLFSSSPRFICFWVFDIICMNSRYVGDLSLLNRLHLIRSWVTMPIKELIQQNHLSLPFEIRMRPMYSLDQTIFV